MVGGNRQLYVSKSKCALIVCVCVCVGLDETNWNGILRPLHNKNKTEKQKNSADIMVNHNADNVTCILGQTLSNGFCCLVFTLVQLPLLLV